MIKRMNQKGMGLLSILFAVAIIGLIYFFASRANKNAADAKDGYLKQTSLDASSYKSTLDSTKKVLGDAVKTKNEQSEGF